MTEQIEVDVMQGAKAAAAAAAVGAAVGIARALATRANGAAHPEEERRDVDDHAADELEQPADEAQELDEQPEPHSEPDREQPQADQREQPRPQREQPQAEQREQPQPQREQPRAAVKGAGSDRLRRVVDQARDVLEELSGVEVESVSALDRTPDGWRVLLEAVEVRRIPESTDVLASYELQLDGDGDLVRYERRRRYSRSQSDQGADG